MSKGLVTLNRKIVWSRAYTIRNASDEQKRLLIEHPISHGAQLVQPAAFDEQTANLYRFEMDLPENEVLVFNVVEETPVSEKIVLTQLNANTLLAYANNAEISEEVRAAFREALRLKNISDNAMKAVTELVEQRKLRIEDQERIRANLTAAGSQTPEGKNYLAQLAALDTQISEASVDIEATRVKANAAQDEYEKYLASLEL